MAKRPTFPSELRFDPLSHDWVIIATGRGKRPETFKKERKREIIPSQKNCPLCQIDKGKMILSLGNTFVIPNKYPALIPSNNLNEKSDGPYQKMDGVGYHEVIITREHRKSIAQLSVGQVRELIDVYQLRYLDLMKRKFVKYVSIFHNHGEEAGASIFHPHSQIVASPVIDPDLNRAISNSQKYFQEKKKCIYCLMNQWDEKAKKRVVFENREFLVVCPFVSKTAFEMIISPKKHLPYFEKITEDEKKYLAQALQVALKKVHRALGNPPYNFYLHTAPCDGRNYDFYHWHWTILPKTAIWAGFELCTGIEISTIEPEKAAAYLKKQK